MGLTTGFSSSYIDWDVRSTGNDTNGGGFDGYSGSPGTDYSLQDSPQITYSDLVISTASNTKCTSSGNAFTSAHVGNIINVVSTDPAWAWGNRTGIITTTAATGLCGNGGTTPTGLVNGVYPVSNTTFLAVTLSSSYWLKFDFGSSVTLTSATWYQSAVAQGTWQWQGSPDNSSWTNVGGTFFIPASATVIMTSMYGNTTAYRYYRMLGVSGTTSNQWVYQMEFNLTFYSQRVLINSVTSGVATVDKPLGQVIDYIAPHFMTAASTPSPYVASDSSHYTTFAAWCAFDGVIGSGTSQYWIGSGGMPGNDWIKIDLGSSSHDIVQTYVVCAYGGNGWAARAPKNWTLQGSNDDISYTTIDTVTNETSWTQAQLRSYTCDDVTTAYRYYKLNVTANNGDTTYTEIVQLYLYATLSNGAGYLGGSLATPATALSAAVSGNGHQVFIKTATYTISSSLPYLPVGGGIRVSGYGSTHNDGGTRPTLTTSASNVSLFGVNGTAAWIDNLILTCTWGTPTTSLPGDAIPAVGNGRVYVTHCKITGFRYGVDLTNENSSIRDTEIGGCYWGVHGAPQTVDVEIHNSWIHNSVNNGIRLTPNSCRSLVITRSVISNNATGMSGDSLTLGNVSIVNCVFYGNSSDGIWTNSNGNPRNLLSGNLGTFLFENNIVYGNGGYGINMAGADLQLKNNLPVWCFRNNAYGANSNGNFHNIGAGANDVTLTGDPFTNAAAGDFTLNATAGAGAACKGTGYQNI